MRDAIFIVGGGRSGSSALARVLGLCGGALPLRLLPANFANPTGYWEPEETVALNDRFLQAHRSSWWDASLALRLHGVDPLEANSFTDAAAALLRDGFEADGPLVIKDPRISGLLPYWEEAAVRAGLRSTFVHVFRDPRDVAASLQRRDAVASTISDALWLKYNLLAEHDARGHLRVFVSYEALLRSWRKVVDECERRLGVPVSVDANPEAVDAFLTPALRHHAGSFHLERHADSELVDRTYEALLAAEGAVANSAEFDALFAALAGRFEPGDGRSAEQS